MTWLTFCKLLIDLGLIIACPQLEPDTVLDPDYYQAMIVTTWPADLHDQALDIAYCESRGRPLAIGAAGEIGLFQIMPGYWQSFCAEHAAPGDLYDPVQNSRCALAIWQRSGWQPWSCRPEWDHFKWD